jgi:hypothetical protein
VRLAGVIRLAPIRAVEGRGEARGETIEQAGELLGADDTFKFVERGPIDEGL